MFCDEPVIRVYEGKDEYETRDGADCFLDCYHDLAYHVTEGFRIVLETENWAITLESKGVSKEPKECLCERQGEWLHDTVEDWGLDEEPYIGIETTLFVGEKLHRVVKENGIYICEFDHFKFRIVPYELGTMDKGFDIDIDRHFVYHRMLGFDRHLKRKCDCGGDGEVFMDFVSDYVVRCRECKKSTWADMQLQTAIDEWNAGILECELDDIEIV